MDKIRFLMSDTGSQVTAMCVRALEEKNIAVTVCEKEGNRVLEAMLKQQPDVVLLELVQPRLDGLSVLRRLAEAESAPPVVVLTGFVNAAIVAECARLGAAYFIPKPCDTAALMQCLRQCAKAGGKSPAAVAAPAPVPAHLESAVTDVLHEIGVPAHVKGYQYLREGILFTIRDADSTAGITKVLYPAVAKKFSATPSCVERSMRHAIDIAWNRGDEDVQEKIFCGAFSGSTGRPTNGEFIATIAELVLQQISK